MYKLIQKRVYAYWLSGALMIVSIAMLSVWGLRLGLDFRGGTLLEMEWSGDVPAIDVLQTALQPLNLQSLTIQPSENKRVIFRYLAAEDQTNDQVVADIKKVDANVAITRTDFVGPSVSGQIKQSAFQALIIAMLAIACYIAWAFRKVSKPVSSWEYGVQAVIALVHDVLFTLGTFAFLGHYYNIEVNAPFIAAILTILGFSVHDTIVVYDRIRENLLRLHEREDFEITVNRSLNETLARSLNTSFTVLFVLAALLIFGGESIRAFSLALFVGIASGAYSSFYIASALLVTYYKWQKKRRNA
ncbi:MAG: protein translocase subunit SecF [Candidatus Moraniibacteriota bacterium]